MNFTLITAIALSFVSPFNLGLAVSTTNEQVQSEFGEILLQEEPEELTQIPGDPDNLAVVALPPKDYEPLNFLETDYILQENGIYQAKSVVTIEFDADATVGDVNTVLQSVQAEIIGAFPGHPKFPELGGIFLDVRVPSDTPEELQTYVEAVLVKEKVRDAYVIRVSDSFDSLPKPSQEP